MNIDQGTTIDNRYRLDRYLGSGSYGEVWLATDTTLNIEVAIKLYISLDQNGQQEFQNEFKVAHLLNHPHLLKSDYYSVWNYRPYLVMKYCANGSASQLVGTTPDEHTVWQFIHDVAAGLAYLHSLQIPILHQDIKPENILIDRDGRFIITDFGISRQLKSTMRKQSKRATGSGALSYMGPERFLKDPVVVKASDIWSLGVSIYEITCGQLPFCGQGGGMLNVGAEIPDIDLNTYSPTLNQVVRSCLARDTWSRPTAAQLEEFAKMMLSGTNPDWQSFITPTDTPLDPPAPPVTDTIPPTAPAQSPTVISTPKKPRNKLLRALIWTATIVVALVLTLILIGYLEVKKDLQHDFGRLSLLCENNIKNGSRSNIRPLIRARYELDTLQSLLSQDELVKLPANKVAELQTALNAKLQDAASGWERMAWSQIEADDPESALRFFLTSLSLAGKSHRSDNVLRTVARIAAQHQIPAAFMCIDRAEATPDGKLRIHFDALNAAPIRNAEICYILTDTNGQILTQGTALIDIDPGNDFIAEIPLQSIPAGHYETAIYSNDFKIYSSTR